MGSGYFDKLLISGNAEPKLQTFDMAHLEVLKSFTTRPELTIYRDYFKWRLISVEPKLKYTITTTSHVPCAPPMLQNYLMFNILFILWNDKGQKSRFWGEVIGLRMVKMKAWLISFKKGQKLIDIIDSSHFNFKDLK